MSAVFIPPALAGNPMGEAGPLDEFERGLAGAWEGLAKMVDGMTTEGAKLDTLEGVDPALKAAAFKQAFAPIIATVEATWGDMAATVDVRRLGPRHRVLFDRLLADWKLFFAATERSFGASE